MTNICEVDSVGNMKYVRLIECRSEHELCEVDSVTNMNYVRLTL